MSTASTTDMDSTNHASYASVNDKTLGHYSVTEGFGSD